MVYGVVMETEGRHRKLEIYQHLLAAIYLTEYDYNS